MERIVRVDDTGSTFDYLEEIVRCKDCGNWDYCDSGVDGTAQGECFMLSILTDDMCFCCWAERREE